MSTKNVMGFLQTKNMERFVGLFLSQLNWMVIMFSLIALNYNLSGYSGAWRFYSDCCSTQANLSKPRRVFSVRSTVACNLG